MRVTNASQPMLCGTVLPAGLEGVPSDAVVPSWVDKVRGGVVCVNRRESMCLSFSFSRVCLE